MTAMTGQAPSDRGLAAAPSGKLLPLPPLTIAALPRGYLLRGDGEVWHGTCSWNGVQPVTAAMTSALDQTFAPLRTALNLRAQRQQLLSANIANANTPGYKAVDLDFSAAYKAALSGQGGAGLALKTDHPRQLAGNAAPAGADFIGYQAGNSVRLDGNSVDMNREQAAFQKNGIQYEADLTFLTGKIKTLTSAITGA